jgi:homopolymeric O-antigen transport system ATP-binding protein
MTTYAIEAEGLGKRYSLGEDTKLHRISDMFMPWKRITETNDFWALKDVSFKIEPGESVGIIGRNGAGKSTLLKVLSRITAPTAGRVRVRGRVGTLLEVGTGFHPELSGRDNIFLSGTILGLSYAEVRKHLDEIIDFSGVGKFIDTPVKRYSSGMQVKLAFAVAVYLEPEILIVDEVLAVGDLAFQRKSLRRLSEVTGREGRTVLFVSHSLDSIRRSCQRVLVLEDGLLKFDGPSEAGVDFYKDSVPYEPEAIKEVNVKNRLSRASGAVRFTRVEVLDETAQSRWSFLPGETARIQIEYEVVQPVASLMFLYRLFTPRDDLGSNDETIVVNIPEVLSREPLPAGHVGAAELILPNLKLKAATLAQYLCLTNVEDKIAYDVVDSNINLPPFVVKGGNKGQAGIGLFNIDYQFRQTECDQLTVGRR